MFNEIRCPECGHNVFTVTVQITQKWAVDADANYIATTVPCAEVTKGPDVNDAWTCRRCGHEFVPADLPKPREEVQFGKVIWCETQIREYLDKHAEYPDDTAFVEDVIQRCVNDALFTESMIRAGWLAIANHAQNALQAWKKGEKL